MSARIRCSACDAEWPATIAKCYKCGQPLGMGTGIQEPFVDPLQRPLEELLGSGTNGAFCDGNKLVMVEGGDMPRRWPLCISDDVYEPPMELSLARETKEMGGISGLVQTAWIDWPDGTIRDQLLSLFTSASATGIAFGIG